MTQHVENVLIGGTIAFLGGLSLLLKGIEAANAYVSWHTKRETLRGGWND